MAGSGEVEELRRQLVEVKDAVKDLTREAGDNRDWRLGFWSNGSGRPEGFFQMRIKADDKRYEDLLGDVRILKGGMKTLLDAQKLAVARRGIWTWWAKYVLAPVLVAVLLGIGAATYRLVPVIETLWDDYMEYHPHAHVKPHGFFHSQDSEPAVSSNQDSQLPSAYQPR